MKARSQTCKAEQLFELAGLRNQGQGAEADLAPLSKLLNHMSKNPSSPNLRWAAKPPEPAGKPLLQKFQFSHIWSYPCPGKGCYHAQGHGS